MWKAALLKFANLRMKRKSKLSPAVGILADSYASIELTSMCNTGLASMSTSREYLINLNNDYDII